MTQRIEEILKAAKLYSDGKRYHFIGLPPTAITAAASIIAEIGEPFAALIVDKDEVTLVLQEDDYHHFQKRLLDFQFNEIGYRLITFDHVLEPDLVGFIAEISRALAENSISILPFAAYSRDHIFVHEKDFETAMGILNQLKGT